MLDDAKRQIVQAMIVTPWGRSVLGFCMTSPLFCVPEEGEATKKVRDIGHFWWEAIKHSVRHGHHVSLHHTQTGCAECDNAGWPGFGGSWVPRGMTRLTVTR